MANINDNVQDEYSDHFSPGPNNSTSMNVIETFGPNDVAQLPLHDGVEEIQVPQTGKSVKKDWNNLTIQDEQNNTFMSHKPPQRANPQFESLEITSDKLGIGIRSQKGADLASRASGYQKPPVSQNQLTNQQAVGKNIGALPAKSGEKPLQSLLKGFRLSQYYRKLSDQGYDQDVYLLGLLNNKEREDMMGQLQLLPGHRERMLAMFNVIDKSNQQNNPFQSLQCAQSEINQAATNKQNTKGANSLQKLTNQQEMPATKIVSRQSQDQPSQKRGSSRYNKAESSGGAQKSNRNQQSSQERTSFLQNQIVFNGEATKAYIKELGTAKTVTSIRNAVPSQARINQNRGNQGTLRPSQLSGTSQAQESIGPFQQASANQDPQNLQKVYQSLNDEQKEQLNEQFMSNIQNLKGQNPLQKSQNKGSRKKAKPSSEVNNAKAAINKIFPQNRFSQQMKKQALNMVQMYLQDDDPKANKAPRKQTSTSMKKRVIAAPSGSGMQNPVPQHPRPPHRATRQQMSTIQAGATRYSGAETTGRVDSKTRLNMLGPNAHHTNNLAKIKTQRASSWVRSQSNINKTSGTSRSRERQRPNQQQSSNIPGVQPSLMGNNIHNTAMKTAWPRDGSQNRSREGSNIGKGIGNFFHRRNSISAQGIKRRGSISRENPLSQQAKPSPKNGQQIQVQGSFPGKNNIPCQFSELPTITKTQNSKVITQTPQRRPHSSAQGQETMSARRRSRSGFRYAVPGESPSNGHGVAITTPSTTKHTKITDQTITIMRQSTTKRASKPNIPLSPKKIERMQQSAQNQVEYTAMQNSEQRRSTMKPSGHIQESSLMIKPILTEVEDVDQDQTFQKVVAGTHPLPKTLDEIISDAAVQQSSLYPQNNVQNGDISAVISPLEETERLKHLLIEANQQEVGQVISPQNKQVSPKSKQQISQSEIQQNLGIPLLSPSSQYAAKIYGHSFNSKKVSQGPTFFNLRLMCVLVGRAIYRHIEFSRGFDGEGDNWLLDDLKMADDDKDDLEDHQRSQPRIRKSSDNMDFTYNLKEELKVTINPENMKRKATKEEANNQSETEKTETTKIPHAQSSISNCNEINDDNYYSQNFESVDRHMNNINKIKQTTKTRKKRQKAEEDPDKESWEDEESEQYEDEKYSEIEDDYNDEIAKAEKAKDRDMHDFDDDEDSLEQLDEFRDNDIDEIDAEISLKETQQIERIRLEETFKQTFKKEQLKLDGKITQATGPSALKNETLLAQGGSSVGHFGQQPLLSQQKLSNLQKIRIAARETLQNLQDGQTIDSAQGLKQALDQSKISEQMNEILAMSGDIMDKPHEIDLDYFDDGPKMTKAEFIMAGMDLEPIESLYSQELKQLSLAQRLSNDQRKITNESQIQSINRQGTSISIDNQKDINTAIQSKFNTNEADFDTKQSIQNEQDDKKIEKVNMIDSLTRELQKLEIIQKQIQIKKKLEFFDVRFNFETETLSDEYDVHEPTAQIIAEYCKYVTVSSKMENETPIIALVYIERLLRKSNILINKYNWKRLILTCLCVASKVWDDDSLENIHFPQVMGDVSLKMINKLEQLLLDSFLHYDLVVKGSEYAKYYFIIRSLADDLRDTSQLPEHEQLERGGKKRRKKRDDWAEYPLMQPISALQMANLQRNAAKAEIYLKERHEKEIIWALCDKFKASYQKKRSNRLDSTM